MSWEIDYLREQEVVRVKTSGTITLELFKRMVTDALTEAVKHGATRFLIDHRAMTPDIGFFDIYNLPETNFSLGVSRVYTAIVYSATSEKSGDFELYAVRARHHGYNHRLFTEPEAALEWLAGE